MKRVHLIQDKGRCSSQNEVPKLSFFREGRKVVAPFALLNLPLKLSKDPDQIVL